MKRTVLILIVILISVYAGLAMLNARGEYAAERFFYDAVKKEERLLANPDVVSPAMLSAAEKGFHTAIRMSPESTAAKAAHLRLAELYLEMKQFDKALAAAETVLKNYPSDDNVLSKAQFLKGAFYERQDRWPQALQEYTILKERYPYTLFGLQIPLYIAGYYSSKSMGEEANRAYNDAVSFYERAAREKKGSRIGYLASERVINSYLNLKKYEEAGMAAEEIIASYPSTDTFMRNLSTIEHVYVKQLNQPKKAARIYKDVLAKTRDARLEEILRQKIAELEK